MVFGPRENPREIPRETREIPRENPREIPRENQGNSQGNYDNCCVRNLHAYINNNIVLQVGVICYCSTADLAILWSLGPVSLSHCVESHIWSLPIYGLWVWFPCPNFVESYGLWVRFPCPTVLNPIYGLCPYMAFWSGFPVPTVLGPMVFGSGFPVPLC